MKFAPVALFVYNRLEHTRRTVEALALNDFAPQTRLFVFSDGPRSRHDSANVDAVRKYLSGVGGFESVQVFPQPENRGLANSIIAGVTKICGEFKRVIVLEDDLVTSRHFLRYMNEALSIYENTNEVISIHGYVPPVAEPLPPTFFIRGADCWGWATWQRGWELFEKDGKRLLSEIKSRNLEQEFNFDGSVAYMAMLRMQIAGLKDSWAVRWYASAFLANKLTLYPGVSLVRNIGNDGTGSHCGVTDEYNVALANKPLKLVPIPPVENASARKAMAGFSAGLHRPSLAERLKSAARILKKKLF
jgi:hypothetical protein